MRVPQELVDAILDHLFLGPHDENRVTDMRATALVSKDPCLLGGFWRVVRDSPHIGGYIQSLCLILTSVDKQVDVVKLLEALPMLKHLQFGYPASSRPRAMFPLDLRPVPASLQSLELNSIRLPNLSALEALLTHGTRLKDLKLRRVVFEDILRCTTSTFSPPHVVIQSLHLCAMRESDVAAILAPDSRINIGQLRKLVVEDTLIGPLLKANSGTIEFVRYISGQYDSSLDPNILAHNRTLSCIEVASTSPHLLEPFGNLGNLKALKTLTFLHQRWTDWSELVPLLESARSLEDIYVYVDASQTFSEHWLPVLAPTLHLRWQ
ncbi:hypothetical protein B0H13DRAFT_2301672 [Mycena leptocephala]|nr:hypothetical protein B0H13DRAFT_2301672 [Mycena leptocephala]